MDRKRGDGHETWHRLLEWAKGQTPSERLSSHILRLDGFESLDPSHPLGGQDGVKDILAIKHGKKWVAGVYFPRGKKTFNDIKDKFEGDLKGVELNDAQAFAFITNQELTLSKREELKSIDTSIKIEIYHLERISSILDSPKSYGVRLEFLDIVMTKEEQVAYFEWTSQESKKVLIDAFAEQNNYLRNLLTGGTSYIQIHIVRGNLNHAEFAFKFIGDFPIKNARLIITDHVKRNELFKAAAKKTSNVSQIYGATYSADIFSYTFKRILPTKNGIYAIGCNVPKIPDGNEIRYNYKIEADNGFVGAAIYLYNDKGHIRYVTVGNGPNGKFEYPEAYPRKSDDSQDPDWSKIIKSK